jgi:hypothetical protein
MVSKSWVTSSVEQPIRVAASAASTPAFPAPTIITLCACSRYMLEVRPETGGLGHATRSQREEDEVLSTFHLADETWHEKQ